MKRRGIARRTILIVGLVLLPIIIASVVLVGTGYDHDAAAEAPVRETGATPPRSPEEVAFIEKLDAFLDYCDGTARLAEEHHDITGRVQQTVDLYAAIPEPVNNKEWTLHALTAAKELKEYVFSEAARAERISRDLVDLSRQLHADKKAVWIAEDQLRPEWITLRATTIVMASQGEGGPPMTS